MGRVLADGVKLVPWIVSILRRQKEQEHQSQRIITGGTIDFSALGVVVKDAVNSLEEAATNQDQDDLDSEIAGKGKGKAIDKEQESHPANGQKIWLHCSVGEPGSLEDDTEATAEKQQVSCPFN